VSVSDRARLVASGHGSGLIWLWDLRVGVPTAKLGVDDTSVGRFSDPLTCLAVSADGTLLACGGRDGSVALWGLPQGRSRECVQAKEALWGLAFSPDGRLLVGRGREGVYVWDLTGGSERRILTGHARPVTDLAITPDSEFLATASEDQTVRLWRLPEGQPLHTLAGHTGPVVCLAMSPDGRVLASGATDATVEMWALPDGRPLRTLQGHSAAIRCLAFTPDGQALVSGAADETIRVWASELVRLSRVPAGKMTSQDLGQAEQALRNGAVSAAERAALEFTVALVRHRRRFDIHLDDSPGRIAVGEFDIEIGG
jgi:WD40 repeat protein